METKKMIAQSMKLADRVLAGLLDDVSDADLLVRPTSAANHMAWQLGHLISSERSMIEGVCPGTCPALPRSFEEVHAPENSKSDGSAGFLGKQQYMDLIQKQREATISALEALSEGDFDKEAPESLRQAGPTVANVFALQALHEMWHIGQLTVLRRHLGKPVVF